MKISVIGAGNVGANTAYTLALKGVANEIILIDIFKDVATAKAMDIYQAACVFNADIRLKGGDDYELIKDSDIVIITAGSPRKEGESREDLLLKNAKVVKNASQNVAKFAPNSIIIVITNPLDVMVLVALKFSGFSKNRILGMAGELDSARLKYEISTLKGLNASTFDAKVIGTHNDEMIISSSNLSINLTQSEFETIKNETKNGGAKIVKLLKTSAFYAPAAGAVKMCEAIKNGSDEILSGSVVLDENLASGRLIRLNRAGLAEILKPKLSQNEQDELKNSELKISENFKFLRENLQ
ncbi:malate dehydrogenase [Campylobacter gastrosuis]|uniref:Malate dehydrogenase n=1 Tax=Campylobacter gastrosuis TaxID=2974576 RepID=A0ABT7HNH8_9BACT|nr:malate dehydrogenase [Campylobacter gastrosuis]MDL0088262.1 malate dehydrogenase [Campylobacter gastrosuis]